MKKQGKAKKRRCKKCGAVLPPEKKKLDWDDVCQIVDGRADFCSLCKATILLV